ncbi:hypothetical protein [Streptosporangium sp. NPDC003464]
MNSGDVPAPDVPAAPLTRPARDDAGLDDLLAGVRILLADAGFIAPSPRQSGVGDVRLRADPRWGVVVTWGPTGHGDHRDDGDAVPASVTSRYPSVRTVVCLAVAGLAAQAGYHAVYDGAIHEVVITGPGGP